MQRLRLFPLLALAFSCVISPIFAESLFPQDVKIQILEADGDISESIDLNYNDLSDALLTLDYTQKLKVSVTLNDPNVVPEQAFVQLESLISGKIAQFSAGRSVDSDALSVFITSAGVESQIGTEGGKFSLSLILGNRQPNAAIIWKVASQITLLHQPGPDGNQPTDSKSVLEKLIMPKPEIKHTHRPAEKRAPTWISYVFTTLSGASTAAFCYFALMLGGNCKGIVGKDSNLVLNLIIHIFIAAILALLLLFWLRFNLLQVLPFLIVFEAGLLIFGWASVHEIEQEDTERLKSE